MPASIAGRTTDWRVWVAPTTMMLCTLLSYIDRQVLAVLSPTILKDTGLTASQYTNAVSAFSFTYMLTNPIWGSLLDYIGLRRGMLIAVSIWTVASASHAFVGQSTAELGGTAGWFGAYLGFALARGLLGSGEGAAFPGALRTAVEALPENRQSRGMALGYSGASMGALLTPLIVTPIAAIYGWRFAFLVTGALGLLWLLLWLAVARPPFLPQHQPGKLRMQWPDFRERRLWVIVSSFGLGGMALGIVGYLSPLYLNRVLGLSQAELGRILWIPFLGWEIGYFFWGWIADRYAAHTDRPVRLFVLLTVLSLPVALVTLTNNWMIVIALFFWATFVADGFVVLSLRVGSRIYPKDRTGMVAGIGSGSWAAVQAAILPIYGQWFDHGWYTACFVSMSVLPMLGTLIWFHLSKPWDKEPAQKS
ncbi:MAG: MFS transporter [Acidobacteriota bacterium]